MLDLIKDLLRVLVGNFKIGNRKNVGKCSESSQNVWFYLGFTKSLIWEKRNQILLKNLQNKAQYSESYQNDWFYYGFTKGFI